MTLVHDREVEAQWERTVDDLFLCELRVVRRLVGARIRAMAGRVRPSEERCRCPYCSPYTVPEEAA